MSEATVKKIAYWSFFILGLAYFGYAFYSHIRSDRAIDKHLNDMDQAVKDYLGTTVQSKKQNEEIAKKIVGMIIIPQSGAAQGRASEVDTEVSSQ